MLTMRRILWTLAQLVCIGYFLIIGFELLHWPFALPNREAVATWGKEATACKDGYVIKTGAPYSRRGEKYSCSSWLRSAFDGYGVLILIWGIVGNVFIMRATVTPNRSLIFGSGAVPDSKGRRPDRGAG